MNDDPSKFTPLRVAEIKRLGFDPFAADTLDPESPEEALRKAIERRERGLKSAAEKADREANAAKPMAAD